MTGFIHFAMVILGEVIVINMLKASEGFTCLAPSICVVVRYGLAFGGLSQVIKSTPLGIAYTIWCGLGIVLVSIAGFFGYQRKLDRAAIFGMILIISGYWLLIFPRKSVCINSSSINFFTLIQHTWKNKIY